MQDSTNGAPRRKLRDILDGAENDIRAAWDSTDAAPEFTPLPSGAYTAHVESIKGFNAKTHTPGVKVVFRIADGPYARRLLFLDCWLTTAAIPQTKRDLAKLGITAMDEIDSLEVPPGRIRCNVRVALRRDDDGSERNQIRSFDVVGIDEPQADAFAPETDPRNGGGHDPNLD